MVHKSSRPDTRTTPRLYNQTPPSEPDLALGLVLALVVTAFVAPALAAGLVGGFGLVRWLALKRGHPPRRSGWLPRLTD